MIPSRRLASVAGDQGVPAYLEAMREWEVQSVLAPPRPTFATVQEVARPAILKIEETHEVEVEEEKDPAGDE